MLPLMGGPDQFEEALSLLRGREMERTRPPRKLSPGAPSTTAAAACGRRRDRGLPCLRRAALSEAARSHGFVHGKRHPPNDAFMPARACTGEVSRRRGGNDKNMAPDEPM